MQQKVGCVVVIPPPPPSAGLQVACENLILLDLEFSSKKEVGARLWRSAHYPVIETLRKQLISSSHKGLFLLLLLPLPLPLLLLLLLLLPLLLLLLL